MAMTEASQPLSDESFSYSWLVNLKPSFNSLSESFRAVLDASDEAFFIEMDPRMPPSKRFLRCHQDLSVDPNPNHHIPSSPETPATVLVPDEIFSNSSFSDHSSIPSDASNSTPTQHSRAGMKSRQKTRSLTRSKSLSKQIRGIYLEILKPLYHKIRRYKSALNPGVESSNKDSPATPPRSRVIRSSTICHRGSSHSERAIYEAVLHCKRTNQENLSSPMKLV